MALRPEARPAIYEVLDRQQKDAFERIVKLIAETIAGIDTARGSRSAHAIGPSTQLPPWLDDRSATRMAFLHGHRGMGKTTVMLSVLRACLTWDDTEYPTHLVGAVRTMRARTVWLEPIALEPLPGSANLLAALLARIDRAVQKHISPTGEGAGDPTARGHAGAFTLLSDQESALLQLQRLQTNVAVAWGGNLPVRGGHLDPDTYAAELLRAERSRLSLKSELSASLDALADAFYPAAAPVTNPLFVLPVDDVDLDPLRCLEILKLLRLVPVPRLFAIVLGNLRIVDLVLNLQYSNEFASAYQGRFLDTLSVDGQEVAGWAGQAAANAVAKLIPLAQRIVLEHMSVRESLNFRPLLPIAQRLPRFHQLLKRFPLELKAGYAARHDLKDLRQFLLGARDAYDLSLMSVDAADGLLNDGRTLVIVALVGTDLHIRIFDANGKRVVDKAENELISGETLTALKKQLTPLPDESGLSQEQKQKFIRDATSIAGHTPLDYEDEVKEKDVEESHCSAKNILRAPPRRIADWWFDLQRLLDRVDTINKGDKASNGDKAKKIHREIVYALGRICYWAINEDHMLPTQIRSKYRRALRINPADIWELVEPVDSIPDIDSAHTLSNLRSSVNEHPWNSMDLSPGVYINHGRGWYLRPAEKPNPFLTVIVDLANEPDYEFAGGLSRPRFNDDSTYALMLLHDLLGLGPEAEVMKQSMQINRPYERWAATVWKGARSRAWISWPAPLFESYWETDLFVCYWNRVVDNRAKAGWDNSVEKSLEPLVFGWIDAARAVWTGEKPFGLPDPMDSTEIVPKLPWTELAQKVAGLIPVAKTWKIMGVMEWLPRLAYFLSPAVSGVRLNVAQEFVAQDALRAEWKQSVDRIIGYHQEIIDFLVGRNMNTLVKPLGRAMNNHLLNVLFPKDSPPVPPPSGSIPGKGPHEHRSKGTSRRPSSKQRGRG